MMSHLIEIDVEEDEDIKSGYTITFVFEKNEFFTNDKIVKKFHMNAEGNVENSTTKFDWKPVRFREFLGQILHFFKDEWNEGLVRHLQINSKILL